MEELFLINKSKGITSYDVIRRLKRRFKDQGMQKLPKIGHAGTLDPMATGLMIIGVGAGTKKLNDYLKLDKTYEAEITLGIRTDASDITGKVLEEIDSEELQKLDLSEEKIKSILASLVGTITLPISLYSALKKNGKPLYEYAREGRESEIEIPVREMKVYKAIFLSFNFNKNVSEHPKVKAVFDVASGTYIRSLAEEIGKRLGTVATLSELHRTRIGQFDVKDAEQI